MHDDKISIDDILNEINMRKGTSNPSVPSSQTNIDEIIKSVLVEKGERKLREDNITLTDKEKKDFINEINSQTHTLSKQFQKLQNEVQSKKISNNTSSSKASDEKKHEISRRSDVQPLQPNLHNKSVSENDDIYFAKLQKDQRIKVSQHTAELSELRKKAMEQAKSTPDKVESKSDDVARISPHVQNEYVAPIGNIKKFNELSKSANSVNLKNQLNDISSHFGNVKITDSNIEESYADIYGLKPKKSRKSSITFENYKELKSSRQKKIDEFKLDNNGVGMSATVNQPPDDSAVYNGISLTNSYIEKEQSELKAAGTYTLEKIFNTDEINSEKAKQNDSAVLHNKNNEPAPEIQSPTEKLDVEFKMAFNTQGMPNFDIEKQPDDSNFQKAKSDTAKKRRINIEYNDSVQSEHISDYLNKKKKTSKISAIMLFIAAIAALLLCFAGRSAQGYTIFFVFNISEFAYIIIPFILLIISAFIAYPVFSEIFGSLKCGQPSRFYLYAIIFLLASGQSVLYLCFPKIALQYGVMQISPVCVIMLFFCQLSVLHKSKNAASNFKYVCEHGDNISTVSIVDNSEAASELTKGILTAQPVLAKNNKTKFLKDFIFFHTKPDKSDNAVYASIIISLVLSIVIFGISMATFKDFSMSLNISIYLFVAVSGILPALIVTLPLNDTAALANEFSGLSPTYSTVERLKNVNSVLLDAYSLFPDSSIVLHGIKTFSGRSIDNAIIDAASVLCTAHSILDKVFLSIIANNKNLLRPVDTIIYEDMMGISAWVDNRKVLIGNKELMVNHSVAVPRKGYEEKYTKEGLHVVYLAAEGILCAAFIVEFKANSKVKEALQLAENNNIKAVIKSVDSCISADTISSLFNISLESIKIIPSRLHDLYKLQTVQLKAAGAAFGNNGSIMGFIVSIVTSKKLFRCFCVGRILATVFSVLSFLAVAAVILLKCTYLISLPTLLLLAFLAALVFEIYQKNMKI